MTPALAGRQAIPRSAAVRTAEKIERFDMLAGLHKSH
jgi:hypothetical protein